MIVLSPSKNLVGSNYVGSSQIASSMWAKVNMADTIVPFGTLYPPIVVSQVAMCAAVPAAVKINHMGVSKGYIL